MISRIYIENFKSFLQKQELKLAPITLIYGPNSSGKSSVIQSLLLLKQSILEVGENNTAKTNGSDINLGGYSNIVSKHELDRDITIGIEFNIPLSVEDYELNLKSKILFGANDRRSIGLTYKYDKLEQKDYLEQIRYECKRTTANSIRFNIDSTRNKKYLRLSEPTYRYDDINMSYLFFISQKEKTSQSKLNSLHKAINSSLTSASNMSLPMFCSPDDGAESEIVNKYSLQILEEIKYELKSIEYLGPLRSYPQRFYSQQDELKSKKGVKNIIDIVSNNKTNSGKKINYWFGKFEIPYNVDVKSIGNDITGDIFVFELHDSRNSTVVTPADVGFGIGQVLPIIAETSLRTNSIICIEQPEIHLHPRLQAHLADLFIDSVKYNNQLIIETHSEALMLRLRRRIRTGKIDPSMVKVIYIQSGDSGSDVLELPIDKEGDFLREWPHGFFEERLTEQFGD